MNASQLALSDAPASWPAALYKSNARSLSSIARSYSRSIMATLLRPLSASGLSPSSSARSRHARAVSQSAAAIACSPLRSRSSRAWPPIVADHLIRATDQPANPTPWASAAPDRYARASGASNSLGSDRHRCRFAPGAVVSAEPDEMPARDERRERVPDGACSSLAPDASVARARTCDARDVQRGHRHRDSLAHCTMRRGLRRRVAPVWRSLGDVEAIGVDWVPRPIWVPNCSAKSSHVRIRFRQVMALRCAGGPARLPAHDHGVPGAVSERGGMP